MRDPNRRRLGDRAEEAACRYLEARGYRVLQRNFRTRRGEIDIVAREGKLLVFIEVKYRARANQGRPEEAVGYRKQQQIIRVAREYLWGAEVDCRFDVVAMQPGDNCWRVKLFRDAFRVDG